jgi:triacylglycerol lipase
MYFPPKFDCERAIELAKLVNAAYAQFAAFASQQEWKLDPPYSLVCEIFYHTTLGFDATSPDNEMTAIDREIASLPVSYSIESLLGRDVPVGFVAAQGKTAYLVFRGTVTPREWMFDADIRMVPYRLPGWGLVSNGFQSIYNRSRDSYIKKLDQLGGDFKLFIAGHSLGGAMSLLSLPDVAASTHFKKPTLYNYGCPRVGDNDFVTAYNALPGQTTFRVVNTSDLVTSVPLPASLKGVIGIPTGFFSHVDTPVDFTLQANDAGVNHATETYIAALSA